MKVLHIADCHLGGWRNEKLEELNLKAFEKALDLAVEKNAYAVLISGDLFDVPLPSLRIVIRAMEKMKAIKDKGIKIYAIAGSHDVSTSNVGIINLFESAKIIKNVDFRKSNDIDYFIEDGLFIIGVSGTRKAREINDIIELKKFLENNTSKIKDKKKILLFHSTVKELTDDLPIESISIDELPDFDYYAFGHIHINRFIEKKGRFYSYPGPTFPNNFDEIERLKHGNCFIAELGKKIENLPIKIVEIENMRFSADNKTPFALTQEIINKIENTNLENKLITLRIEGALSEGRTSQIEFDKISQAFEKKNVFAFLKNTSKLNSKDFDVNSDFDMHIENIEKMEHDFINKLEIKEKNLVIDLIKSFDKEKIDGETNLVFEDRLIKELKNKEDAWNALAK